MALEPKAAAEVTPKPSAVSVGVETDTTVSAELSLRGGDSSTRTTNADASSLEFDGGMKPLKDKEVAGAEEEEAPKENTAEEGAEEAPSKGDLGDWDASKPEVQEKFDARYFKEGKLNQATLSAEYFANKAKDPAKAGLNEQTYKYLEDTLGIDRATIKEVEAGQEARNAQADAKFYESVGGKARYDAALEWGRKNYTPAQKERFNKLRAAGGEDFRDAAEALISRFQKANPQAGDARRGPPSGRTSSAPARSASSGAAGGTGASAAGPTYATQADYSKAWSEALAAEKAAGTPADKRKAREHIEEVRRAGRQQSRNWK